MSFVDADTQAQWEEAWKEEAESTSKSLGINYLRNVMLSLGKDLTQKELKDMCNGGSSCTFDSFTKFMLAQPRQQAEPVEVRNAIQILAQSSGGTLRTAELRLMLTSQGEKLTHEEAATMVGDADPKKTGYVDVEAFTQLVAGN